jgi:hypothetical protein
MDVQLYLRILWRFRVLVAAGVLLAISLAVLSFAKVSFAGGGPTVKYRQAQIWQSEAVLFVTQRGFPWGTTTPQYQPANPAEGLPPVPTADANRLSSLAVLYAQLATTHQVQRLMRHLPAKPTDVSVTTIAAPPYSTPAILPVISVKGLGTSPARAAALAADQARAIVQYVGRNQRAADTPQSKRVLVQEVQNPLPKLALVVGKRKKTLPIIVFLAVMVATLGLVFVLENMRPGDGAIRALENPLDTAEDDSESDETAQSLADKIRRYG